MSDLDDLNHNQQLGNLGSIIGREQQREIIRQNEELLDLKRKEEDLRKQEEQRKSVLPLCPDCKLLVEKDAKVCANCGLQIVTIQLSCLSSRCYAFSRKTIREDLAKKVNELQSVQSNSYLKQRAKRLNSELKKCLNLICSDKSLQNDIVKYGEEVLPTKSKNKTDLERAETNSGGAGCGLWLAVSILGPPISLAFLPQSIQKSENYLLGIFFVFGPCLAVSIYLKYFFDPFGVKSKRHAVEEGDNLLQKIDERLKEIAGLSFDDVSKKLREAFNNLSSSIDLVSKVEADKNRCFKLANSFSLDIEKPEVDPIYLGLAEVNLRFHPRPSKWLTEFPNLSMVISKLLGENNSLSSNDSATIQKKSIQAETNHDGFYIKLLNEKIIGPYTKNQIKDGMAKNKIPAGCFFSKSENGPWKALKIS